MDAFPDAMRAQAKLNAQQKSHRALLDNFEKTLERLQRVPLHPALQAISQSTSGESVRCTWLLDTVPVEKENMVQLQLVFDKVTKALGVVEGNPAHSVNTESLAQTVVWMEGEVSAQRMNMKELRESYHAMTERISSILEKVPSGSMMDSASSHMDDVADAESTDLVKALASGSRKQDSEVLQPMEERCARMMESKGDIERAKNRLAEEVYRVMRQVAVIQTDIQFKLKKGMDLMKKWRHGHNGYFQHLERMQSLPEAYRDFLLEVIRRNRYTADFEELIQESVEKIKRFRDLETERRAKFMATCGSNLSPFFFDSVPSLIEKPPYFSATVTERQQLPEVTLEDVAALQEIGIYSSDEAVVSKIRNSGSLTSSMSSGGIPPDESSAIDTGRSHEDTGSKPSAGDHDRIQQLERENEQLRCLLTVQQRGVGEAVAEQTLPASPVGIILADLSRDLAEILRGVTTPEVAAHVAQSELSTLKVGDASEMQKSVDFRLSETIDIIERLNATIRKAQTGFDSLLTSLQLSGTEDIEPLSSFKDVMPAVSALNSISSAPAVSSSSTLPIPSTASNAITHVVPKLSFLTFDVGDLALFLPTNKPDVFLAFSHAKCPNRYLSQDSLINFKSAGKSTPGYILGKIVFIETRVASNADSHSGIGPESSPLRLQEGTEYHLLEVEHVSFGSSSKSSARKRSSKNAGGDNAAVVEAK
ncbi:unnamed protein product [Symbiodinium microadriaticum]|nr:unnamed protein product [Symbiodinium microadriaticum]